MRSRFTIAVRAAQWVAFFVSALFLLSLATPMAAHGQVQTACANRDEIVSALESRYGERPVAAGLAGERVIVEIFAAPDGATWTILLTRPDGISCAVLIGEAWRSTLNLDGDST